MVVVSYENHFVKRLADQFLFLVGGGKTLESGPQDKALESRRERLRAFPSTIAEQ